MLLKLGRFLQHTNKANACNAAVAICRLCLIVCVAGWPRPQEQIRKQGLHFLYPHRNANKTHWNTSHEARKTSIEMQTALHILKKTNVIVINKIVIIMKLCPYCKSEINSSASVCPYCHSKINSAITISDIAWLIKAPFAIIAWCCKPSRLKWIIRIVVCLLAALYVLEKCAPTGQIPHIQ